MITLEKDNAVRVVGTEKQATALEAFGFVRTGGTAIADPSMAPGTYPFNLEDMTDPHTPYNRGVGAEGELAGAIGSLVKQATIQASQEELEALMQHFSGNLLESAGTFTEIVNVNALPTVSKSATKIYMLMQDDAVAEKSKGIYKWVVASSKWEAYTFTA